MNLRCALVHGSETWKQVLLQCGIPSIEGHRTSIDIAGASVIVVDGRLSTEDAKAVLAFLEHGGSVIGYAGNLAPAIGMSTRKAYVRYLVDERADRWCDLLDLDSDCQIPREANMLKTDQGTPAVFAGDLGGGHVVLLPFDLRAMWERLSYRYRNFPSRCDRQPFELVSTVNRAECTYLIGKAIEFLHHSCNVPHVRLWPFPGGAPSVLGLRLDTDKGRREDITAFAKCSDELHVPFTWFVDTGSHEGFLEVFSELPGQEIGIHCDRHVLYESVDDYRTDIRLARAKLARHNIHPVGYAAPFGEWTEELGVAIDDSRLLYSSEFSLGYDGFPFLYRTNSRQYVTPQVPVHPISTGALRRAGYTAERMVRYYASVVGRKICREEPVFLLDHPVHRNHEVMREVLREGLRRGAVPVRMGGYLEWWRRRATVLRHLSLSWEAGALTSCIDEVADPESSMRLRITTPAGSSMQPIGGTVAIHAGSRRSSPDAVPDLDDLRRAREFDLRTSFGVAFIRVLRRFKS